MKGPCPFWKAPWRQDAGWQSTNTGRGCCSHHNTLAGSNKRRHRRQTPLRLTSSSPPLPRCPTGRCAGRPRTPLRRSAYPQNRSRCPACAVGKGVVCVCVSGGGGVAISRASSSQSFPASTAKRATAAAAKPETVQPGQRGMNSAARAAQRNVSSATRLMAWSCPGGSSCRASNEPSVRPSVAGSAAAAPKLTMAW